MKIKPYLSSPVLRPEFKKEEAGDEKSVRNVKVTRDGPQNETTVAINPENPDHLVAGANDYLFGDVKAGYYTSRDGGKSWSRGILTGFSLPYQGDPAVAANTRGDFYFATLAFERFASSTFPPSGIFVSRSSDGGKSFSNPVAVADHSQEKNPEVFEDKEYITVDTTESQYRDRIYVSWTSFHPDDSSSIMFSHSTDDGKSFSPPMPISDNAYAGAQGSIPAVGPDGEVYVLWWQYFPQDALYIDRSDNGGNSFGPDKLVAKVESAGSLNGGIRLGALPSMDVDRSNGPNRGSIYVVWTDMKNGDADVYLTRSKDKGKTWSEPIRVNDDSVGNGTDQFFPWVSVDPETGDVHIVFYDRRNDPDNLMVDVSYARSTNGGESFEPNQKITEQAFDPRAGFPRGSFIGDYIGIAARKNKVYPVWTDTRDGEMDVYTHPMEVARHAISKA